MGLNLCGSVFHCSNEYQFLFSVTPQFGRRRVRRWLRESHCTSLVIVFWLSITRHVHTISILHFVMYTRWLGNWKPAGFFLKHEFEFVSYSSRGFSGFIRFSNSDEHWFGSRTVISIFPVFEVHDFLSKFRKIQHNLLRTPDFGCLSEDGSHQRSQFSNINYRFVLHGCSGWRWGRFSSWWEGNDGMGGERSQGAGIDQVNKGVR